MRSILVGKSATGEPVELLPAYANRHGLVAGATGTGKTVTLMTIAEGLSRIGVPVFMADVKGDVAGLAVPGTVPDKLKARIAELGLADFAPEASPVISGGQPAPHPIQGIGAGFIPRNLHTDLLDGVIKVDAGAAKDYARRAATEEGMLVGISSGATLAAIAQKLAELPPGTRVLGFNYDTGERYLSVPDFLPEI